MPTLFESNLALLDDTALAVQLRLLGPQAGHTAVAVGTLPEARELVVWGTPFDAVRAWLEADANRHAYFIETDVHRLAALLATHEGSRLLSHERASLHTALPEVGDDVAVVGNERAMLLALASRARWKKEDRAQFRRNLRANLAALPNSFLATDLWGQFAGVPAIICGAGPSLDGAIPVVNRWRDRALVLAGGSALRAEGLLPHLGGAIDPRTPPVANVPLFFRHRTYPGAHGYYVSGASGYPEVEVLDDLLGIPASGVDEGVSVTCFLISIAQKLGCSPIHLVGVDLGPIEGREYAKAVGLPNGEKSAQWVVERAWIERHDGVVWEEPKDLSVPKRSFDFSATPCPPTDRALDCLSHIEACERVLKENPETGDAIIAEVELACLLSR